jgi:YidC/Oxa1 family membrane protein insertase
MTSSFEWLLDAMGSLLAFFYSFVPNYGAIIVLLTLAVMVVVTPLTIKGTRSMMMMQSLQPEIRKLQTQHKEDRQKLNEELMGLYKENQVNPVGGCLPLLVQAPVFMVLYAVLRGLTRRVSDLGYASGWVSGGEGISPAGATKPPGQVLTFDPAYLPTDSALYESLAGTTQMKAFGIDLAQSASDTLSQSFVQFIPYALLILLVAITGFVQQRQIQGRVSSANTNRQQQMIMKFLPIMLPIFSFTLPGGLVLYFAVSNLYRVGQQWFISRKIYGLQRGESIDQRQTRVDGGAKSVKAGAPVIETTAKENATKASNGAKGARSATEVATKNKGADGTRARKDARPAAKRSGSSGAKSSRGGQRRSPSGGSPAPTVQPRGRKKKR